jgi:hypothetical protein
MLKHNTNFKVKTPHGFKFFSGIQKIYKPFYRHIIFDDNSFIKCSDDHPFGHEKIKASALKINHVLQGKKIVYNEIVEEGIFLYDLLDVEDGNVYYTNDLISHNCEFLGSSNTLIDPSKLQTLVFTYPIKTVPYFGSDLKVYMAPVKGNKYIITVDVAQGAGLDYSICQVIDITSVPYRQVATYKNNIIHTLVFPDVIRNIGIYYNEALILVEINDIGKQVVDSLHYDLEYEGILTVDKSIAAGQKLTGGFGTRTQMGVRTTTQVKRIGCSNLKTLIESDKLLVCDFDTINELFRFVSVRNTFQAEDGNDDLVMGLVLFSWLINQPYFKDMSENDVHKVLVEAAMEDDLLPFIVDEGYISYGNEPIDVSPDQFDPFLAN